MKQGRVAQREESYGMRLLQDSTVSHIPNSLLTNGHCETGSIFSWPNSKPRIGRKKEQVVLVQSCKKQTLLEELSEKEEEAKNKPSVGDKKQNAQQEKAKAEEMRLKAMETMGQTKKRVEKSSEVNPTKKRRKSTGDAIEFLQKKAEQEMALRREEIEMRKQEDMRGSQQTTMQHEMLRMIQQQQEDQLKQQQRNETQQLQFMQSILNQQQQQSEVLLSLIERLAPKENK